ncbi:MAG: double-strand break repair protein AddB, partial [Rhizobiaceae bacterium]
ALFRLMLDVVFGPADPVNLLSLLKHPLARLGNQRVATRKSAEVLELLALRGDVVDLQLPTILEQLKTVGVDREGPHTPNYIRRLKAQPIEQAVDLAKALSDAIAPLMAFAISKETTTVAEACAISVAAFEAIGRDEKGSVAKLYDGESAATLAEQLRKLVSAKADFAFEPREWPSIFNALISGQMVKPRSGSHPHIHIWGALEARLQHVETVVLGGLNEKTWPARPVDDPLMSRSMKAGINIEPPERRVGLAAHDFQMLMGTRRVILSRSARVEGAPSVPSRWLQRLHALIGEEPVKAMRNRAADYLHWGRQLDLGLKPVNEPRPCPTPALHLRPKSLSVTEISTLRRDPYAIHAKHILGLQPLEPLLREPDALERGNLFHKIVEEFVRERKQAPGDASELIGIGKQLFAEAALPEDTHALWWRRFERMVGGFIEYESERAPLISTSHVELTAAKITIADTGVVLGGRADRIDLLAGGPAEIVDYKTGTMPSATQVISLMEPQLPLEAALLKRGGFFNGKSVSTSEMTYVQLKSDGSVNPKPVILSSSNKEPVSADQLAERAWDRLIELIRYFSIETNGYISRKAPFKETYVGDYDHLARVAEWSGGGDESGGDTP